MASWPVPRSISNVRSFIGLASYNRSFVPDFAAIAGPLHALTAKAVRFKWDEPCQTAFEKLKRALTSSPILAMPTDTDQYILDTEGSDQAIGTVLSQVQKGEERVIAYASRTYNRAEVNYCTRKELLAVVYFLKHFKQYLLGSHFLIRTDHAALTWLQRAFELMDQQGRWQERLQEFTFDIQHRPGVRHGNADALSRRPCEELECRGRQEARCAGGDEDRLDPAKG